MHIYNPEVGSNDFQEFAVHYAIAPRATFAVGVNDAARQALAVLCSTEGQHVNNSDWKYFPRRAHKSMRTVIAPILEVWNGKLVTQVGLTATLNTELDGVSDEIQEVRKQLAAERKENEELRAQLKGENPPVPSNDEEDWVALLVLLPKSFHRTGCPFVISFTLVCVDVKDESLL